ncbi:MAG TPA: hypothetical protein VKU41_26380 [Polyangiaceae bacterium]|nr:hypothetical protein [Polyangiaceae bacterium]
MRPSTLCLVGASLFIAAPARGSNGPPWSGWTSTEICRPPPPGVRRSGAVRLFAGAGLVGGLGSASDGSGRVWGAAGKVSSFALLNVSFFSEEFGFDFDAGGGSGGGRVQLAGRLLFGFRGYVTPRQGPFVRVGAGGVATGQFFYDYFGLPLVEAGYEYIDRGVAVDVGAMGAVGLMGGFGVHADRSRDLGGTPMAGAYSLMIARPAYLRVEWQRVLPHAGAPGASRAVDDVQAAGCVRAPGLGFPAMLCTETGIAAGRVDASQSGGLVPATAFTAGVSVGVGVLTTGRSPP